MDQLLRRTVVPDADGRSARRTRPGDAGYYRPDYTHVYRVDLESGVVRLLLTTAWSETPTGMAWAFGSLWITNFDNDTIWRVDPGV